MDKEKDEPKLCDRAIAQGVDTYMRCSQCWIIECPDNPTLKNRRELPEIAFDV